MHSWYFVSPHYRESWNRVIWPPPVGRIFAMPPTRVELRWRRIRWHPGSGCRLWLRRRLWATERRVLGQILPLQAVERYLGLVSVVGCREMPGMDPRRASSWVKGRSRSRRRRGCSRVNGKSKLRAHLSPLGLIRAFSSFLRWAGPGELGGSPANRRLGEGGCRS